MIEDLVLPVPPALHARYVVAVASLPGGAERAVADAFAGLPADLAVQDVVVTEPPLAALPPLTDDVLVALGAAGRDRSRPRRARRLLVVEGTGRPGSVHHEWAAALVAARLADRLDAPLLDLRSTDVVDPARLRAAVPAPGERLRLVDWVKVRASRDLDGVRFTTKGLGRFGLPELRTEFVPPPLAGRWGHVLDGLASVLARAWWTLLDDPGHEPAFVTLPAAVDVAASDVVRAQGLPPYDGAGAAGAAVAARATGAAATRPAVRVGLELDPAADLVSDTFLGVVPPPGPPTTHAEFLAAVCDTVVGPARGRDGDRGGGRGGGRGRVA